MENKNPELVLGFAEEFESLEELQSLFPDNLNGKIGGHPVVLFTRLMTSSCG
jgi:hypothetical protein